MIPGGGEPCIEVQTDEGLFEVPASLLKPTTAPPDASEQPQAAAPGHGVPAQFGGLTQRVRLTRRLSEVQGQEQLILSAILCWVGVGRHVDEIRTAA